MSFLPLLLPHSLLLPLVERGGLESSPPPPHLRTSTSLATQTDAPPESAPSIVVSEESTSAKPAPRPRVVEVEVGGCWVRSGHPRCVGCVCRCGQQGGDPPPSAATQKSEQVLLAAATRLDQSTGCSACLQSRQSRWNMGRCSPAMINEQHSEPRVLPPRSSDMSFRVRHFVSWVKNELLAVVHYAARLPELPRAYSYTLPLVTRSRLRVGVRVAAH